MEGSTTVSGAVADQELEALKRQVKGENQMTVIRVEMICKK